jgi:hypothetical protein
MRPFLMILALVGCSNTEMHEPTLSILKGTWVNRRYADALKENKSPFKAYTDNIDFCEIDSGGIQWGIHSGVGFGVSGLRPTGIANEYRLIDLDRNPMSYIFVLEPQDSLKTITWWSADSSHRDLLGVFDRITGSIDRFCNQIVISGLYQDNSGRKYSFSEDGEAVWPDQHFKYEVSLDPFCAYVDYFIKQDYSSTAKRIEYGFQWQHESLMIFRTRTPGPDDNPDVVMPESSPFIILKKK